MHPYEYFTPTRILFGINAEANIGDLLQEYGANRVLIHYGGGSAIISGLIGRIQNALMQAGISCVLLGGVKPNPRLSLVYEGIALARKEGVDFILAVGGGSVIDSAKAIAYGLATESDVWDFFCGKAVPTAAYPVGCVLTIAAAGSEMSNSCVITNEDGLLKRSCKSDLSRCRFAIMDPALTLTLPDYQTASGCTDILMHTMERYFHTGPSIELTDRIAEALLQNTMQYALRLKADPRDLAARTEIMWAGSLSHNGLTSFGANNGDWATHQLEHELGGMFDVAHGAGLSAVWGSWARYACRFDPTRFARFAIRVMGLVPGGSDHETAMAGIAAMEEFFQQIGMPTNIRSLGITLTDEQLDELAHKCTRFGTQTVGGFIPLDEQAVRTIYQSARGN